ncbi:hypothetical protein LX36DRAFT_159096 [Colletotrichum falcatum]|nr:hypothetical protein LX36DRAFT_159096 [Colletotrichum falcatum]
MGGGGQEEEGRETLCELLDASPATLGLFFFFFASLDGGGKRKKKERKKELGARCIGQFKQAVEIQSAPLRHD